jgi:hypothetical protein
MTWEWSFLLSVFLFCLSATGTFALWFYFDHASKAVPEDFDPAELKRLAEETKKLLSEERFAKGFGRR